MIDFKNIHRDDVVLGNIMRVEEPERHVADITFAAMIDDIPIGMSCLGHIEPGKYFLEEENAILLRFDDYRFIELRNFNPYIGPLLLHTIVKKNNPNNGILLFDSPSFVVTGNRFVDCDTIHSCDWLEEESYTLKKLKNEVVHGAKKS